MALVPSFFFQKSLFNFLKKKSLIFYRKFYLYKKILRLIFLLVFTLLFIKNNTLYCGDTGTQAPIPLLQEAATQAILEQMTDTELDAFARHIGYPIRRTALGWEAVDYYRELYFDNNSNRFNYQALFYWLAGTTILFIIARWGNEIKDFIFSLPERVLQLGPDIYEGLTATMRHLGRETVFRENVSRFTLDMIQNPERTALVQEAFNIYLRGRGIQALSPALFLIPPDFFIFTIIYLLFIIYILFFYLKTWLCCENVIKNTFIVISLYLVIFLNLFRCYLTDYWTFSLTSSFCLENSLAVLPSFFLQKSIFNFLKKKSYRFIWLFWVIKESEKENSNSLETFWSNISLQNILLAAIFYIGIIYLFYKNRVKIFSFLLKTRFSKVIYYICYKIIQIKGLFELEHPFLPFFMCLPTSIFLIDLYFSLAPYFDDILFISYFHLTLGLNLIILDSIAIKISEIISLEPDDLFSIQFSKYLETKKSYNNEPFCTQEILSKGLITKIGKLTAAGQAAIAAGIFGSLSAITVSYISNSSNSYERAEDRKHEATQKAEDRKHEAAQKAEKRKHQADTQKAQFDENEAQRQHERAQWSKEEKDRAYEVNMKNSSWWFRK